MSWPVDHEKVDLPLLPLLLPTSTSPRCSPGAQEGFSGQCGSEEGSGMSVAWGQLDMKSYNSPSFLCRASALSLLWPGF